jgi:hypothetical protein
MMKNQPYLILRSGWLISKYYDENDAKISLEYAQNILNYVEEYINECSNDNKGKEKK